MGAQGATAEDVERSKRRLISKRYLRNAWYAAAWGEELPVSQLMPRTILNQQIVFFRREDGTPAALLDRCAHRFSPLHMGKILPGDRVQCPYHGLQFGVSGACVHNPHGNGKIAPSNAVRAFPVVERHKMIWIWMGEHAPDMDRIPDFGVMNDDTEFAITKLDRIVVKANVELIVDNLLDLSHTSFLHEGILGNSEMVDSEIDVREESGAVIVGRSSTNTQIPGMFAPLFSTESGRVDKWNNIRWTAPSNLLLRSGVCTPGADPESGTGYYGIHLLTPESDETTHYFFTAVRWNMLTQGNELNGQIREKLSVTRRFAFEDQDAPVIEAQQERIDRAQDRLAPVFLSIDVGPVRYKRILERLMDDENAPAPERSVASLST